MGVMKFLSGALILTVLLAFPIVVLAQTDAELEATIRSAILSDPRTADMTEAEIDAIVAALAEEAGAQGVTSYDILWQPQEETLATVEPVATCNLPEFFCTLNAALGLDGSDIAIPIGLGVTAALLLFVIGSILHHRHGRHPLAGDLKATTQ